MNQFGTLLIWLGVLLIAVPYPTAIVVSWFEPGAIVDPGYGWAMLFLVMFIAVVGFVMVVVGLLFRGLSVLDRKLAKTAPVLPPNDIRFRTQAINVIKNCVIAAALLWGSAFALGLYGYELSFLFSNQQRWFTQTILLWSCFAILPVSMLLLLRAFLKSKSCIADK
jgi:hypothetical protein